MTTPLAVDRTVRLNVDGSTQSIRLCAERAGLPPLLVVQAGPGLPILHEVPKFQQRLNLEPDFTVAYWEQRGCGPAANGQAAGVSLTRQVEDLRAVLGWLRRDTGRPAIVLGLSIGATIALRAIEREPALASSIVAVSPDTHTGRSDASAAAFLHTELARAGSGRLRRRMARLEKPPYLTPAGIQRRAGLLADFGSIEYGKTFSTLLRETLVGMATAYGIVGAIKALQNVNRVQRALLPDLAALDLFARPVRLAVPVHCVFGDRDALTPADVVAELAAAVQAPTRTVRVASNAGHMVHFDRPDIVRSMVVAA